MQENDGVLLASFPRSGSTLTCQFIAKATNHAIGHGSDIHEFDIIPNLVGKDYARSAELERFPLAMRTHDAEPIGRFRTHFMYRRPDDALGSYYFFLLRRHPAMRMEKFFPHAVSQWRTIAQAALHKLDVDGGSVNLSKYEDHLAAPAQNFSRLLAFIGGYDGAPVAWMVDRLNAHFRHKMTEVRDELQPERGAIGHNAKVFDDERRAMIERDLTPLYDELSRRTPSIDRT